MLSKKVLNTVVDGKKIGEWLKSDEGLVVGRERKGWA